jgi:hypothetical protein
LSFRRGHLWVIAALVAVPAALVAIKIFALGYELSDALPLTKYKVTLEVQLDGHGEDVKVRSFLPASDRHQLISEEQSDAPGLHFTRSVERMNSVATWSGAQVPDGSRIVHSFSAVMTPLKYELDPDLPVPAVYPASVAAYLRPEPEVQVDDPAIAAALDRIGAAAPEVPLVQRLRRIHDFTAGLTPRDFKGTTNALTALRLGEASCNGKSRLFVALARAARIPARLVGGLILESGHKRTSHQWVEVYIAGHWVPFCPTNGHFAELPARYLVLYRGDETLFRHSAEINFQYRFDTTAALVPSPRARASFRFFNVWALFERLGLPFSLLRTLLMLPIGALIVVLFRNVIGLPTFGTFLPALIAAAAGETGALWGIVGVLLVVAAVAAVRALFHRLELLHSPTLAILLAAVVVTLLAIGLVSEKMGLLLLARVTLFPIAVLAITAERFFLSLTQQGTRAALRELGGTLVVILACYAVMNTLALQVLVIGFPEVLLAVIAADVYLGRWVGLRLSEYLRFRGLLGEGNS